MEKKGFPYNWG